MPKQKDLKDLIRARRNKTGESHTVARAHLLAARASLTDAVATSSAQAAFEPEALSPLPVDGDGLESMIDLKQPRISPPDPRRRPVGTRSSSKRNSWRRVPQR